MFDASLKEIPQIMTVFLQNGATCGIFVHLSITISVFFKFDIIIA